MEQQFEGECANTIKKNKKEHILYEDDKVKIIE